MTQRHYNAFFTVGLFWFAAFGYGQADDLSIRFPEKTLKEKAEEERLEKEAKLRSAQSLATSEKKAIQEVEKSHAPTAKSLELQIDSANRRIKDLRQRIEDIEDEIVKLKPEIEEFEQKAEQLEREARNLWDFPDIPQPGGGVYSNRARAEALFAQAETYRTRAESRRNSLESRLKDLQRSREELKKLQGTLSAAIGKRETKEFEYRREIERVRAEIRARAMGAITTDDLISDPGLLRQFNLGREMELLILDFAETAHDAKEKYPLDEVLAAIEAELAEAEFVELLKANTPQVKN